MVTEYGLVIKQLDGEDDDPLLDANTGSDVPCTDRRLKFVTIKYL